MTAFQGRLQLKTTSVNMLCNDIGYHFTESVIKATQQLMQQLFFGSILRYTLPALMQLKPR